MSERLHDIARVVEGVYRHSAARGHPVGGVDIHMTSGEVWFHPYSGAPPWRVSERTPQLAVAANDKF